MPQGQTYNIDVLCRQDSSLRHSIVLPKYNQVFDPSQLLKDILSDKMHEPYRLPLIQGAEEIKEFAKTRKLPVFLSGSGSTMIIIFKDELDYSELNDLKWDFGILEEDNVGAIYEE